MPSDSIDPSDGPPDLHDITPWLVTYVRANFAEHQSPLFDSTPSAAIEAIVQWTLAALVINTNPPIEIEEEETPDAEETGKEAEEGGPEEGPNGRPS